MGGLGQAAGGVVLVVPVGAVAIPVGDAADLIEAVGVGGVEAVAVLDLRQLTGGIEAVAGVCAVGPGEAGLPTQDVTFAGKPSTRQPSTVT